MEKTADQVYIELLGQLASPSAAPPGALAEMFRDVERMHAMGRITERKVQR